MRTDSVNLSCLCVGMAPHKHVQHQRVVMSGTYRCDGVGNQLIDHLPGGAKDLILRWLAAGLTGQIQVEMFWPIQW
jgi:hypothetical protein